MPDHIPIFAVDFDGVLHSYTSGWRGARNIPDPPVNGAIPWLRSLLDDFQVEDTDDTGETEIKLCIFSSRSRYWGGRKAIKNWLLKHGLQSRYVRRISFPLFKPPSFLLLDDRVMLFKGKFPTLTEILTFKPWHDEDINANKRVAG